MAVKSQPEPRPPWDHDEAGAIPGCTRLRFLFPINLSGGPVRKVTQALNDLRYEYPKARISVIAHSFGTVRGIEGAGERSQPAIVEAHFLRFGRERPIALVRVEATHWRRKAAYVRFHRERLRDRRLVAGTGSCLRVVLRHGGATGFSEGFVTNRFHRARGGASGGHGLYFNPDFVTEKWRPFLIEDAEPAPGDGEQGEHLPWWVRLLYHGWARWICRCVMLVFWLLALAAAAGAIWWAVASAATHWR